VEERKEGGKERGKKEGRGKGRKGILYPFPEKEVILCYHKDKVAKLSQGKYRTPVTFKFQERSK
jgi:hypothetical protein